MDSPNVQLALAQQAKGLEPTGDLVVEGVLSWELYQHRRRTWDKVRQCIGLDGQFYEGAETLLYPPDWLNTAAEVARKQNLQRPGGTIGVDTAEGGDNTSWAVMDEFGLKRLISLKTPDTVVITGRTIALMQEYGIEAENVMFDQGGGGQEHADRLRYQGYEVGTVSFGESVAPEPVRYMQPWEEKIHDRRERFSFKNRRAQMYWMLHLRLNPGTPENPYPYNNSIPFAIPSETGNHTEEEHLTELRRQLAVMPKMWDDEGRVVMPPKRKKAGVVNSSVVSLEERLGCSPDEADAVVLSVYAMDPGATQVILTSMF